LLSLNNILHSIAAAPNYAGIGKVSRGIEKESLRVTPKGTLSNKTHPPALGAALTHSHITTDYSEALLEFITEPSTSTMEILTRLEELHAFTYQHIGDEQLWVTSMPCVLGKDENIPIAQYGSSNIGQMKSVYRLGLGHRYGRSMQTIAGIHYNFSVSDELWAFLHTQANSKQSMKDFKTQGYFRLIRNFRRYFWLLLYLFGASPSICKSFVRDREHALVPFNGDDHTLHSPYATSLRMGDLGYQSSAQDSLVITYNCLNSYIGTLCSAITQTHDEYVKVGINDADGHYRQLSDKLLQIENEFYSVIRPKRTTQSEETAIAALASDGIEYIEVRCMDLNPYENVGINQQQMQFLDTFLLYCLLSDSPLSSTAEYRQIQENQKRMVYRGRDPELTLFDQGKERPMREWAEMLLVEFDGIASLLDKATNNSEYSDSVNEERKKLKDASLTPSARILADMKERKLSFYRLALSLSEQHKRHFIQRPLTNTEKYEAMAIDSIKQQQRLEASDTISFDEYVQRYYAQYQCSDVAMV